MTKRKSRGIENDMGFVAAVKTAPKKKHVCRGCHKCGRCEAHCCQNRASALPTPSGYRVIPMFWED